MEKERERAAEMNYPVAIQPDKAHDRDFRRCNRICLEKSGIAFVAGTHNEESIRNFGDVVNQRFEPNHPHVFFCSFME
jgi:proline dehydrogenase